MYIGIDSFSYHRFFGDISRHEADTTIRWQVTDFLNRACDLGVQAVSLQTTFFDSHSINALVPYLEEFSLGFVLAWGHPNGLNGGRDRQAAEDLRNTLAVSQELGCSLVRFVAGHAHSFKEPVAERIERLIPTIRSLAETAAASNITLAIENHADFKMSDLVELVERVDRTNLGICFDGVNAVRVGDDLLEAARLAIPHIRMVHIRDWLPTTLHEDVEGFWPSVSLGSGKLDIESLIRFFETSGYTGGLFVEIAYLHPDYADEDRAVTECVSYLKQRLSLERQELQSA